jgi:chemotaxis protein CheX
MTLEADIGTFIRGVTDYFVTAVQQAADVGVPFLALDKTPALSHYTGAISVTGRRKGTVYFTAPRGMLTVMLMRMQETDTSHQNLCDLVGEIANTLSGNARRDLGSDFVISVPKVHVGADTPVKVPDGASSFVIPINWRTHAAQLVVALT